MSSVITHAGDCLEGMRHFPDQSVDLVLCSPPYESARTYGVCFDLKGEAWVKWAFYRFMECYRVCKGAVVWVVEGRTSKFQYSATPMLLAADLHRAGVKLRKPPVFYRHGIPGSGGTEWFRNDYEFCICATHGRLPWSDNTAMGSAPKYGLGGETSHRTQSGARVNQARGEGRGYRRAPKVANPGNVIRCKVGGGHMGSELAHENEAPFPESLAEFFIRSLCPPGGIVLDPFCGSGTTLAVAVKHGRSAVGIDLRESQVDLSRRRVAEVLSHTNKGDGNEGEAA